MIKTMFRASVGAIALIAAVPALADDHAANASAAPVITAPEIEFTQWTLDNGLRVIAIPDNSTGTVMTSMWYEIGSKLDPEGRSGFAHLFEHILSRKTANMPYNMIYGLTADVGGTRNASNSPDRTNYFEIVPAAYLETMLWTHRERMAFPVIDQEVFDAERDVVKEELRTRVLAPPYGRFQRFVLPESAYDVSPYRRPGIGSIEELNSATLDDARSFYQAYYGPDTATLIVAGNFDMERLRGLVSEYFDDIKPRANPVSVEVMEREPKRMAPRTVNATAPNVPLPLVGTIWKLPPVTHPDAPALEVLDGIMSRGDNSRMHKALVKTGKAVDAVHFARLSEVGGMLAQFAITNPATDADEVAAILVEVREKIATEMVSDAELAEAKAEIMSSALSRRETARGRAFELGEALVLTGDPASADKRLAAIAAVTAEDVLRVAKTYYDPQGRTDITYTKGEDDPSKYANPAPFPTFRTLPAATGEPLKVLPEGERQLPPEPGETPKVIAPNVTESTLGNGITVVAAQTGNVPIATMTVLVPGGSKSDPRAKAGIAEMAASLANQGTDNASAEEIAAKLESLGASFGATAGTDGSFFSLTAPVANFDAAGEVLADIIANASYPAAELARERKRTIDGLQVSFKQPGSLASYAARVAMYGDASYGTLPGGTPESLAAIERQDLLAHRYQYWHPKQTKIIVSGGLAPDAARGLAEKLFGNWEGIETAPADANNSPAGKAQPVRTIVIDMPDAGQAAVRAIVRAPERSSADFFPLRLANSVLGGGSSGWLFEEVRTKRSLSYGAYSGFPSRADDSILSASAQTANETVDEVAGLFLEQFERLGTEELPESLLAKRRLYLTGGYSRSLESSSGFNSIIAGLLQQGLSAEEAFAYAARLDDVTPEQASASAKTYVDPDKATLVIVGNSAEFLDDLKAIRPEVEVISIDDLDLSNSSLTK
ncbi:MAG: pitrilysin family protein [Erythrobacter sp.]